MLYIRETGRPSRTRFGEHRRAVIGNDANQPVARHFTTGNYSASDMEIRAICPILVATIAAKDTKCLSFPNLALSTTMALMNVFPMFKTVCLCLSKAIIDSTFNSSLIP
jgi:hypothetical protein